MTKRAKQKTTHSPMRTTRRTDVMSPAPWALAAIGMTAYEKPEPAMNRIKNICVPRTDPAKGTAPSRPIMIVSVT